MPTYVGNPDALICPSDPLKDQFDFDAPHPRDGVLYGNAKVASCGYGMNYLYRHFGEPYSFNTEHFPPTRPEDTILLGEVGPDLDVVLAPFYGAGDETTHTSKPWRDGGRLIWDNGQRSWFSGYTWLTARHRGGANFTTLGGIVKRADTVDMLNQRQNRGIEQWYERCASGDCYFCNYHPSGYGDKYHYDLSHAGLYWWTGDRPNYP